MEQFLQIKKEIEEKKEKAFLGLQRSTEKQLESLMLYLDHPKLMENQKIAEELVELYYNAKASGFMKMEGVIRKLDQLNIMLGDARSIQKKGIPEITNYALELKELKERVNNFMQTITLKSLPAHTQQTFEKFREFLNHPALLKKKELFAEMLEKYNMAEASDFTKLQALKDLLIKVTIKLGSIPIVTEKEEEETHEKEKIVGKDAEKVEEGIVCNSCGIINRIKAKYCDSCGSKLIEDEINKNELGKGENSSFKVNEAE